MRSCILNTSRWWQICTFRGRNTLFPAAVLYWQRTDRTVKGHKHLQRRIQKHSDKLQSARFMKKQEETSMSQVIKTVSEKHFFPGVKRLPCTLWLFSWHATIYCFSFFFFSWHFLFYLKWKNKADSVGCYIYPQVLVVCIFTVSLTPKAAAYIFPFLKANLWFGAQLTKGPPSTAVVSNQEDTWSPVFNCIRETAGKVLYLLVKSGNIRLVEPVYKYSTYTIWTKVVGHLQELLSHPIPN